MKKRTPVSKIMSTNIITVNKNQELKEVDEIIKGNQIRHVPVVSGDKVIGMLSKTDLQKISFINTIDGETLTSAMYDVLTVEQVMTRDLATVQKDDTIHEVAVKLSKKEFHALPVLDGTKLVGIVTTTDLIQYLIDLF